MIAYGEVRWRFQISIGLSAKGLALLLTSIIGCCTLLAFTTRSSILYSQSSDIVAWWLVPKALRTIWESYTSVLILETFISLVDLNVKPQESTSLPFQYSHVNSRQLHRRFRSGNQDKVMRWLLSRPRLRKGESDTMTIVKLFNSHRWEPGFTSER